VTAPDVLSKPINEVSNNDVEFFSKLRGEPEWVLRLRLKALEYLRNSKPDPLIDPLMTNVVFKTIIDAYERPTLEYEEALRLARQLGIPEDEIKLMASGFSVNVDNKVLKAYLNYLKAKGVIIESMDSAIKRYAITKEYAFKALTPTLNRRVAYHVLLWSGGAFIYVPPKVKLPQPLYGLFIIGKEGLGQTEHTLIIVDEHSQVEWIEGCTAPLLLSYAVHLGGLEGFVRRGAHLRVISINNWLGEVHHRPVKKVVVEEEGYAELTSIAFLSKTSYTSPTIDLIGRNSKATIQNIGLYRKSMKVASKPTLNLIAPNTSGQILNRTVVMDRAKEVFMGYLKSWRGARNSSGFMSCNTLVIGDRAVSKAIPSLDVREKESELSHEASIGRVDYNKLYYLSLLGFNEEEATWIIVNGFLDPVIRKLPYDLQVEVKKVIALALKGH